MEGKQKVALTFALYQNDALARRETVTHDIIKLGKDAKSHLRIDDELASRMHAVIEVASADDITLIDLGNEPGTLVNGARINKSKIHAGDQIQIGGTRVVFERAEPVAVAAAPSARGASSNPFSTPASSFASPFAANPFGGDAFAMPNPFAPAVQAHDEVPADAPEGSYTYTLVKSAADVPADEVEDARASTVEVMILWDATVLHVQHLTPPRSFFVGEEQGKEHGCDFFIPSEKLGTTRAPIVLADHGSVSIVLPQGAKGTITLPGQPETTVRAAIEQGKTQPCAELAGAQQLALPPGSKAKVEVGGITFQISTGNAGRAVAGRFQLDTQSAAYAGISLALHAGLLAAMAFFMPPLGATDADGISSDQQYMIQQYLMTSAEREQQETQSQDAADAKQADDKEGGTGARAKSEEGAMGDTMSKEKNHAYAIKGPSDNTDKQIANKRALLADAADFGIIGLINSGAAGDPVAPTAPWGRDVASGSDPLSANGNMWGPDLGTAFGAGGLGLSGIGEGGGGKYEGVGMGALGTIGHGAGLGDGDGIGNGHGHVAGAHHTHPPTVRVGGVTLSGRLPPEVIQRIVRQNFGRFRLCYENGLRSSPNLQGRVAVRFVIGRDGAVSNVANGGSDLPDSSVVSCVQRAFYGLSFPQPENGIVTVTYPIMLTPGS